MSGLELPALVLGIIPVIVEACKSYTIVKEKFHTYRNHVSELSGIRKELQLRSCMFRNWCQILVELAGVSCSVEDIVDKTIERAADEVLKLTLGESYEPCVQLIQGIIETLDNISRALRELDSTIEPHTVSGSTARASNPRFRSRIALTFDKSGIDASLKKLQEKNLDFQHLLSQFERQKRVQQPQEDPQASHKLTLQEFSETRRTSQQLHDALQDAFSTGPEKSVRLCMAATVNDGVHFDVGITNNPDHKNTHDTTLADIRQGRVKHRTEWFHARYLKACALQTHLGGLMNSKPPCGLELEPEPQVINGKTNAMSYCSEERIRQLEVTAIPLRLEPQVASNKGPMALHVNGNARKWIIRSNIPNAEQALRSRGCAKSGLLLEPLSCCPQGNPAQCTRISKHDQCILSRVHKPGSCLMEENRTFTFTTLLETLNWNNRGHVNVGPVFQLKSALQMAHGIFKFHRTPWLKEQWRLTDLHVLRGTSADVKDDVIQTLNLEVRFPSQPSQSEASPTAQTSEDFENEYGINNMMLFSLGTALLELSIRASVESMSAVGSSYISTARRLANTYSPLGTRYKRIVQNCLRCTFCSGITDLEHTELQLAVYDKVVCELERMINFLSEDL